MRILLVDDEPGVRHGLSAWLKHCGHQVRGVESVAAARAESGDFDIVISDWCLTDGSAGPWLETLDLPVLVVTGTPEQVVPKPGWQVLRKPILPKELSQVIDALPTLRRAGGRLAQPSANSDFAVDVTERLQLLQAICGSPGRVIDDGTFVRFEAEIRGVPDRVLPWLEALVGDHRILNTGHGPRLEVRMYRDGRPDGETVPIAWNAAWPPSPEPVLLDFGQGGTATVSAFAELVANAREASQDGRTVHFLNVPTWLRLFAEISGMAAELPKRPAVGPRLPEVLAQLWR